MIQYSVDMKQSGYISCFSILALHYDMDMCKHNTESYNVN